MCTGSGMSEFEQKFPEQYFDVGIAEQHAITFAGGLATQGLKPVVAIYSTFLQRGYDQLIHDIALQNLNVIFAIDRAGLVGADGATHAGCFDLSFLRCIPNLTVMIPSNGFEMFRMFNTALKMDSPVCIRYPRGSANIEHYETQDTVEVGKANILLEGSKTAIFAYGNFVKIALEAGKELGATVIDMRFIKPLDEALISKIAHTHQQLISIEDNAISGGGGSAISEYLHQQKINTPLQILGLTDDFTEQGSQEELYQQYGLTAKNIINVAL